MGLPEVSLGVTPGYGGTQRLPQLVGKGIAMELILSANMINVERGEKVGLLNHIISQENLLSFSTELAKKIISNSSSAIAASIKCINSNFKDGKNGYLTEISEFSNCFQSEDFIEGTNAFINKRKANFK
jgi:enoyl-CoA hydratase